MAANRNVSPVSSKQATTVAQARLLELKALGLGPHANAGQIVTAINKRYGSNPPVLDNRTGLPYTHATARAAGSGQLGPKIVGGILGGEAAGGILDSILSGTLFSGGGAAAGAADAAVDTGVGAAPAAAAAGGTGAGAAGVAAGGLFAASSGGITSVLDFLKFIAWIFHPQNILRAVEFIVGVILMIFGFHTALQARGERIEGFSTSEGALSRSGLGRVATALGQSARGGGSPQRPRSAPHRTRQRALSQRYKREEDLQRRRAKAPRPKKESKSKKAAVAVAKLAK